MFERVHAVGMIEFNCIAAGIEAADTMFKAVQVEPLMLKTICPGKFVAAVYAEVASVQASVGAGLECAKGFVVDHFVIPNIDEAVIRAMFSAVESARGAAVAVIETFSAASAIVAADVAIKAADVDLIELRIAMGLGGKAFFLLRGDVGPVTTAAGAGAAAAASGGLLVRKVVIPNIAPEVLRHLL